MTPAADLKIIAELTNNWKQGSNKRGRAITITIQVARNNYRPLYFLVLFPSIILILYFFAIPSSWIDILTVSPTSSPPVSNVSFHNNPKSLRFIFPVSSNPAR